MKRSFLLLLTIVIAAFGSLQAQDMILKKNNEVIHCKIKEIGLDEVKYSLPDYPADLTFSLDKDRISKLIFENGTEMEVVKELSNPANYEDNKKNALKIDFMSPLTGNTSFSYERSLGPRRSIEGSLGIIGLGLNVNDENAGGAFVKFGYKFAKDPDFYLRGMRYAHILKGSYVKPEIAFGVYGRNYYDYYNYGYYDQWGNWIYVEPVQRKETVVSGAIQVVLGKQWIFDNAFLLDLYWGVGYGFSTKSREYDGGYHYGFTTGSSEFPIAASAGIKMGFLFK
jgi:hypothetical protein